jgi:hypothetical protein
MKPEEKIKRNDKLTARHFTHGSEGGKEKKEGERIGEMKPSGTRELLLAVEEDDRGSLSLVCGASFQFLP